MARLLDAAPGLKYKAALSVAYGAGAKQAVMPLPREQVVANERSIF
jgi:hypothetical protein